ncbi:MAG TPA: hypothetical protein GX706_02910 [Candidatus Moranbacteria bacterium]|nr:hypothetical protein [Candidatus Moranbacteria bacterium]
MFERNSEDQKFDYSKLILTLLTVFLIAIASFQVGRNTKSTIDHNLKVEELNNEKHLVKNDLENEKLLTLLRAMERKQIKIPENTKTAASNPAKGNSDEKITDECLFIASKNSTKYHRSDCSTAQRIKESNRICFASEKDAESEGYTAATDCAKK